MTEAEGGAASAPPPAPGAAASAPHGAAATPDPSAAGGSTPVAAPGPLLGGAPAASPVAELRAILVNPLVTPEREALRRLRERLDDPDVRADEVSRVVAEALRLAGARGPALARALLPELDRLLGYAVARDPDALGVLLERPIALASARIAARDREARLDALERSLSPRSLRLRLRAVLERRRYADLLDERDLVYRVEHVLLLQAVTGAVLGEVSSPRVSARDREVVGRALGPVQSFLRASTRAEAVNVVRVEDRTVYLEVGEHVTLAAIVRGTPPRDFPERLARTLEATEITWRAELARAATDGAAPPAIEGVLAGSLAEEWRSEPARRRGLKRSAVLAAAVLVLAVAAVWTWSALRFARAVQAVDALPGVVVTRAGRPPLGRARIAGLRDPLAPDPAGALRSIGIDPAAVELALDPFVSLEPPIVAERAARVLEPPPSVTLTVAQGRVKAVGSAPHAWIVDARERARGLPGIAGLDEEELVDGGIETVAQLAAALEARSVSFAPGSASVPAGELAALREAAGEIKALAAAAHDVQERPRVVVVGIPSGPGPAAQALAGERAQRVVAALGSLGADPAVLGSRAGRPPASPAPTPAPAPAPGAAPGAAPAAERAISFDVKLEDIEPE